MVAQKDFLIFFTIQFLYNSKRRWHLYAAALVRRIDKIIGLFCKRDLQKRRYSAKEIILSILLTVATPYHKKRLTKGTIRGEFFLFLWISCDNAGLVCMIILRITSCGSFIFSVYMNTVNNTCINASIVILWNSFYNDRLVVIAILWIVNMGWLRLVGSFKL